VASSWILLVSYQDDARSNTHRISIGLVFKELSFQEMLKHNVEAEITLTFRHFMCIE